LNTGDCAALPAATETGCPSAFSRTCVESNLNTKLIEGPDVSSEPDFLQELMKDIKNADKTIDLSMFIQIFFKVKILKPKDETIIAGAAVN